MTELETIYFYKMIRMLYHMNQRRRVVRLSDLLNNALTQPRGPAGPSTTNRPSIIGLPLSFAICSKVPNALSICPVDVWYLADSGSH